MVIKTIVFDVGGILYSQSKKRYHAFCRKYKIKYKDFKKFYNHYGRLAKLGKLSKRGFPRIVAKSLGIKDFNNFYKDWIKDNIKYLKKNKQVDRLLLKLKKKYLIAALTNVTKTKDISRKKGNYYKHFKFVMRSNKVGMKKADPRIYKLIIKKIKLSPEEILFIDNAPKNLPPARKLGMRIILFKNNTQLIRDLKKLKIL
ncbi:MAG: HAD-IA family hydrolase [archaeon]|nr:MAG: HAD-IA family hydrolase [archaeon]